MAKKSVSFAMLKEPTPHQHTLEMVSKRSSNHILDASSIVNFLQNLSERARTQLASADIIAELPVIAAP